MKTSYFKIDRDIQNHWLWSDKPFSKGQAWIDLILLATHTDHKTLYRGELIQRNRGEVHVSIGFLADRWGWSTNKVRSYLTTLENEKMARTKGTTKGTTITIEKYTFYQGEYQAKGITKGIAGGIAEGITEGIAEGIQTKRENKDKKKFNKGQKDNGRPIKNKDGLNIDYEYWDNLSPKAKAKWEKILAKNEKYIEEVRNE